MRMLLLISFFKLLCREEFFWDKKSEIQSCGSLVTFVFNFSHLKDGLGFVGLVFVFTVSVFSLLRLCYLMKLCILLSWNELSWNEMILNEGVSKAATARMYCLSFMDSSSSEHWKWLCVALSVSPGLFSAVGGSCLLGLGGVNRILAFLPFSVVAWEGCGVLSVRYHSKAVGFLCCIVRPGFTDSHQSYPLVAFRHLFEKAFPALNLQGWTSCSCVETLHRSQQWPNHWSVCAGMEVQSTDRGVLVNCLTVLKWRTLPNALFVFFVCFEVWGALAARVFPIPAVTTSPLRTVRRQRCWTTSLSVLTGLE